MNWQRVTSVPKTDYKLTPEFVDTAAQLLDISCFVSGHERALAHALGVSRSVAKHLATAFELVGLLRQEVITRPPCDRVLKRRWLRTTMSYKPLSHPTTQLYQASNEPQPEATPEPVKRRLQTIIVLGPEDTIRPVRLADLQDKAKKVLGYSIGVAALPALQLCDPEDSLVLVCTSGARHEQMFRSMDVIRNRNLPVRFMNGSRTNFRQLVI